MIEPSSESPDAASAFLISVVIPTYNVARYLPDFLSSLERQTFDIAGVELVFVNDGSTDESPTMIDRWAVGREGHVRVVHQANQGLAGARNAGLRVASGEWISFPDPDDVLDSRYFEEVVKFIRLHGRPEVTIVAAHQMRMSDDGVLTDTHPSRKRFEKGSRVVNMRIDPIVQLGVNGTFLRRELVLHHGLTFDHRIRPTFEDAHLVGRYLLMSDTYHLGLMASAKYHYRQRGDGTSLVQSGYDRPEKYVNVLRFGELDLLKTASAIGPIPRWLENTVLYDLVWYFKNERTHKSPSASAPREILGEFHALAREILAFISPDAIRSFNIIWIDPATRYALLNGYSEEATRPTHMVLSTVDETRQLVKFSYWFTNDLPAERFVVDGRVVEPVHETVQDFEYYERTLARRRHVWLPRGQLTVVDVDGRPMPVARGDQPGLPEHVSTRLLNPHIEAQRRRLVDPLQLELTSGQQARAALRRARAELTSTMSKEARKVSRISRLARKPSTRAKYRDAWVFMDRDSDANDNAEHLYRHVMTHHPDVNSWFVLSKQSDDWSRLEREGFRLVDYKSDDWHALMLHARQLASSHIDEYVVNPLDRKVFGQPRFKFTFLQHGVIHNDLSRWLNNKPIELFVTTTTDEFDAIAGDSPYSFSSREVALTGLPRYDALLRKRRSLAEDERDIILFMPTWRQNLVGQAVSASNTRARNDTFNQSEYARQYSELLRSPRLRTLAQSSNKRLVFMPHPNMRPYLQDFKLPDVEVLDFATTDVQDVLARSSAFVTDYTSVAFDAAYLDIPVVYFQFDAREFFGGTHVRRGYFDHRRDGFGPVVETADGVIDELGAAAGRHFSSAAGSAARVEATFPRRDEENSERVFNAMARLLNQT